MTTERERCCLVYLNDKMWATAATIGLAIYDAGLPRGGSNFASIGAVVLGRLRKRGLVTRVPELNAWRITRSGRQTLAGMESE